VSGRGSVVSRPVGLNCGWPARTACADSFAPDRSLTLIPRPAPGLAFEGWGGACARTPVGPCIITVGGGVSYVAAAFRHLPRSSVPPLHPGPQTVTVLTKPWVKVRTLPPGIHCPRKCSAEFPFGSLVRLAAGNAEWCADCRGEGPFCLVFLDRAVTVRANLHFSAKTEASVSGCCGVNVTVSGHGVVTGGSIRCSWEEGTRLGCEGDVPSGHKVTFRAHPARNFRFAGWGGGFCRGRKPCRLTVFAPLSVEAAFGRR